MTIRCIIVALFLGIAVSSSGGCRNGCNNSFTGLTPWRPFAQNTTIPPPGTNSLNVAGNPSGYYNPNATANNSNLPNTGQAQPVNPNWQPTGTPSQPGSPNTPLPNSPVGMNNPQMGPMNQPINQQLGQATAYSGSFQGSARQVSPDFYTTNVNERNDPSRMPMTDATMVRATSPFQNLGAPRMAQIPNPGYQNNQGYVGSFVRNNGAPQYPNQMAYADQRYGSTNTVLASSSTAPTTNPNTQNGWVVNGQNQSNLNR